MALNEFEGDNGIHIEDSTEFAPESDVNDDAGPPFIDDEESGRFDVWGARETEGWGGDAAPSTCVRDSFG